ncbi:MAG: nitroreductase family protein [Desulfatibacillum sp.]|nr:nitroreductase family protein [Desulfatibacillum sp.]
MPLFTVDPEKCNKDGICVLECPMGIISMENKDAPPIPAPTAEEGCIHCGHCVAVCPTGALSLADMQPEQCLPVQKDWHLSPEKAEHFLRSRRSIRRYKDTPVSRETLEELIRLASYAQSGHNSQPVQWRVVYDKEKVHELAGHTIDWMRRVTTAEPALAEMLHMDRLITAWEMGYDLIMRSAPHLVVAHADADSRPGPVACHIALTYAELAAPPLGIGTCWAGFFTAAANGWQPLRDALGLPDNQEVHGGLMVGVPKFKYYRMPLRNAPKVNWL